MFAYCRNNPVCRKDVSGTEDVCVDNCNEDDTPLNDLGNPSGSGSGSGSVSVGGSGSGSNGQTTIYRYGYNGAEKLVPSESDANEDSGLSFSTRPQAGSAVTTIEEINATGKLYAVQDGRFHVSVYPVGGTIGQWYTAGVNSIWTQALVSVVIKN